MSKYVRVDSVEDVVVKQYIVRCPAKVELDVVPGTVVRAFKKEFDVEEYDAEMIEGEIVGVVPQSFGNPEREDDHSVYIVYVKQREGGE